MKNKENLAMKKEADTKAHILTKGEGMVHNNFPSFEQEIVKKKAKEMKEGENRIPINNLEDAMKSDLEALYEPYVHSHSSMFKSFKCGKHPRSMINTILLYLLFIIR